MKKQVRSSIGLLFACVLALGFTHYFVTAVSADCSPASPNGAGGDNVSCIGATDTNPISTSDNNDNVTSVASTIQSVATNGGDDNISLNSTHVNGGVSGDDSTAGNDTITGFSDFIGGDVNGGGGNDSINFNTTAIQGDVIGGEGNDTITVEGSPGLFDNTDGKIDGGNGDDNITVGATVLDSLDAGDGNDTVTVVDSARLSSELNPIDGGAGDHDVLKFQFASASKTDKKQLQQQLDAQNATGGFLTYGGQTYYWVNFEELGRILDVIVAHESSSGSSGGVTISVLGDSRLNDKDVAAPIAVFCTAGSVEVWVINPSDGHGDLTLSAHESTLPQEASGVALAVNGDQVTASYNGYNYSFPAVLCPG